MMIATGENRTALPQGLNARSTRAAAAYTHMEVSSAQPSDSDQSQFVCLGFPFPSASGSIIHPCHRFVCSKREMKESKKAVRFTLEKEETPRFSGAFSLGGNQL